MLQNFPMCGISLCQIPLASMRSHRLCSLTISLVKRYKERIEILICHDLMSNNMQCPHVYIRLNTPLVLYFLFHIFYFLFFHCHPDISFWCVLRYFHPPAYLPQNLVKTMVFGLICIPRLRLITHWKIIEKPRKNKGKCINGIETKITIGSKNHDWVQNSPKSGNYQNMSSNWDTSLFTW